MNLFSKKGATGESHSKVILVGEHAVVYGKAAIAIPFPLKISANIMEGMGGITISSLLFSGTLEKVPMEMKGISECIKKALAFLGKSDNDINIELESEIPMGRGLGSSAASATALAKGIYAYFGKEITREELFFLVELEESYSHGKPSGIDMMAVTSNSPIYFTKENGASTLEVNTPFYFVVADTGRIGDTKRAVSKVKETYQKETDRINGVLNRIGEIAEQSKKAILIGDSITLGSLLNQNHIELKALGISDDLLDSLVDVANSSGALGAKLTGGGMGGCMLALVKNLEDAKYISKELIKNGAAQSWYFSTNSDVLYTP